MVKLAESGLAVNERFSFYDQVHTTGRNSPPILFLISSTHLFYEIFSGNKGYMECYTLYPVPHFFISSHICCLIIHDLSSHHIISGMDIKQAVDACAALTLGKDMVFRDYAQGAFRMRGIGKGQTICLLVTPGIHDTQHPLLCYIHALMYTTHT